MNPQEDNNSSEIDEEGKNAQSDESAFDESVWGEIDDEDKELITNQGFKSPKDVIKSLKEARQTGEDKINLPKADDEEAMSELFKKLGKPDSAADYDLGEVREVDEPVMEGYKEICHKSNILPSQSKAVYEWFKANQERLDKEYTEKAQKEFDDVQASWGDDLSKNQELMKRGTNLLGLPEELLENIEVSIGTKEFMNMGLRLGVAVSEDVSKGLGGGGTKTEAMSTEDYLAEVFSKTNQG